MTTLALSKHLLWKDYRQMRPALLGCWAILTSILLFMCILQLVSRRGEIILADSILIVLSAPTLAAMAASGILIGHERQTRTWNWTSSIPVPWVSSLVSKTVVWFASSVMMVATLWIVYTLLMLLCRVWGMDAYPIQPWITPQIVVMTVLVVPLIVYICFSYAALLWNDTLSAFVGASLVVGAIFILLSDPVPRILLADRWGGTASSNTQLLGMFLVLVGLVLLPFVLMVRAYEWRWTSGQLASIGWGRRLSAPVSAVQRRIAWHSYGMSGESPGEFRMLLTHAISISLGTRLMISLGTFALVALASGGNRNSGGVELAAIMGAALMGVTAFAADQSLSAYKFFADRGVRWVKLLFAHLLPPLVLAMVPVVVASSIGHGHWLAPVCSALAVFCVGVFCSLCSSMALLSVCMTVGALMLAGLAAATLESIWNQFLQDSVPYYLSITILIAEFLVLVVAFVNLVRRWLIHDRVYGVAHYVATLLVGVIGTHVAAVCLCFLTVPSVPWQGAKESNIRSVTNRPVVFLSDESDLRLGMLNSLYTFDPGRTYDAIQHGYSVLESRLIPDDAGEITTGMGMMGGEMDVESENGVENAADAETTGSFGIGTDAGIIIVAKDETEVSAKLAEFLREKGSLNAAVEKLKNLEHELDSLGSDEMTVNWYHLSNRVDDTAWLAAYATQRLHDLELARRAWKVNRRLLKLVDYTTLGSLPMLRCRFTSVVLRRNLSPEDWDFLRRGGDLDELQPDQVSQATWVNLVRMWGTQLRLDLRSRPLAWIVPLQWFFERQIALDMHVMIGKIQGIQSQGLSAPISVNSFHLPLDQLQSYEAQLPRN